MNIIYLILGACWLVSALSTAIGYEEFDTKNSKLDRASVSITFLILAIVLFTSVIS